MVPALEQILHVDQTVHGLNIVHDSAVVHADVQDAGGDVVQDLLVRAHLLIGVDVYLDRSAGDILKSGSQPLGSQGLHVGVLLAVGRSLQLQGLFGSVSSQIQALGLYLVVDGQAHVDAFQDQAVK